MGFPKTTETHGIMHRFLVVALVLAGLAACARAGCHSPVSYGPQNTYPILNGTETVTFVKSVPNGHLYTFKVENDGGNTSSTYNLVHVYGTPYEMGYAQGELLKEEASEFISSVWSYLESMVTAYLKDLPKWLADMIADVGLDAALDATEIMTKKYTNPVFYEEMQGLADASGADYKTIVKVHMIAGLTQGACSMFGMHGAPLDPTAEIGLLQLRALDWDMDGPFRSYNQITVYHPVNETYGHSFMNIGFSGFLGGLTGVSSVQLGISEIGASYPDATFGKESRVGDPFIFLLRDILQYDYTVDDATNRMINSKRTCDLMLGVGDGKLDIFHGYEYSSEHLYVFDWDNLRPYNTTWHPRIEDVVYWGMDWDCPSYNEALATQIQKNFGKITPEVAIKDITAPEMSGDNHLAYYDLTHMMIYVSFAASHTDGGNPNAYARQFTVFDANALFDVAPPTSFETDE